MNNINMTNLTIILLLVWIAFLSSYSVLLSDSWYNIKQKYLRAIRPLYFKVNYARKEKRGTLMSLVYELTCSAPVDHDVMERRLTVKVNGDVVSTDVYSASTTVLGEKTFTEGDSVVLTLVDVDDVGNVSEPATVEFVAADTLPPSVPGFSVTLVREDPLTPVDQDDSDDSDSDT